MNVQLPPNVQALLLLILGIAVGVVLSQWRGRLHAAGDAALAGFGPLAGLGESMWEQAAIEWSSPQRRQGLWAECFARVNGDAPRAMALYLRTRVRQLQAAGSAAAAVDAGDEAWRYADTVVLDPEGARPAQLPGMPASAAMGWSLITGASLLLVLLVASYGIQ